VLYAPLMVAAQQAQTTTWANVRAGPARDYPLVQQLPPAAPVSVQGCLFDFSWCDVVTPDNLRGWVYGGILAYPYNNAYVPVIRYGPSIGLPIVTFVLGSYWGSHYRHRPWYGDWRRWDSWQHRHAGPGRRPPPPYRPDVVPGPRPVRPVMRPPVAPPPVVRPAPRPPVVHAPSPRPQFARPSPAPSPAAGRPAPRPPVDVRRSDAPRPAVVRPAPRPRPGEAEPGRPAAR